MAKEGSKEGRCSQKSAKVGVKWNEWNGRKQARKQGRKVHTKSARK
jgi:hypothetical protein